MLRDLLVVIIGSNCDFNRSIHCGANDTRSRTSYEKAILIGRVKHACKVGEVSSFVVRKFKWRHEYRIELQVTCVWSRAHSVPCRIVNLLGDKY